MMDKCNVLKRLLACALCAGLIFGCLSMVALASSDENADTKMVDSVFSAFNQEESQKTESEDEDVFSEYIDVDNAELPGFGTNGVYEEAFTSELSYAAPEVSFVCSSEGEEFVPSDNPAWFLLEGAAKNAAQVAATETYEDDQIRINLQTTTAVQVSDLDIMVTVRSAEGNYLYQHADCKSDYIINYDSNSTKDAFILTAVADEDLTDATYQWYYGLAHDEAETWYVWEDATEATLKLTVPGHGYGFRCAISGEWGVAYSPVIAFSDTGESDFAVASTISIVKVPDDQLVHITQSINETIIADLPSGSTYKLWYKMQSFYKKVLPDKNTAESVMKGSLKWTGTVSADQTGWTNSLVVDAATANYSTGRIYEYVFQVVDPEGTTITSDVFRYVTVAPYVYSISTSPIKQSTTSSNWACGATFTLDAGVAVPGFDVEYYICMYLGTKTNVTNSMRPKSDDPRWSADIPSGPIEEGGWYAFFLKDSAGYISTSRTQSFSIDTEVPSVSVNSATISYNEGSNATVDFSLTLSDNAYDNDLANYYASGLYGYEITTTPSVPSKWKRSFKVADTFSEVVIASAPISRDKTYYIWVVDFAGNYSYTTQTVNYVTVDSFTYTADEATPGKVTLTATASGGESGIAGYYLQKVTDGSVPSAPDAADPNWVSTTAASYSWENLNVVDDMEGGTVTYYAWAKDGAGNVSALTYDDDGACEQSVEFTQPKVSFVADSLEPPVTADMLSWKNLFSYGGSGGVTLSARVVTEGTPSVTSWQWQMKTDNGWVDLPSDWENSNPKNGASPTSQTLIARYGIGHLLEETNLRVKASGDWGSVYSYIFRVTPTERPGVSAKAILSGTSEEYTNGPVKIQLTLQSPRYPTDAKLYGYTVSTASVVADLDLSELTKQDQAGTYEVDKGEIEEDTTFYAWAKGTRTNDDIYWMDAKYTFGSVPIPIKYDAKAPTVTATADGQAKSITVKAEDIAEGNSGISGIKAFAIHTGATPVDGDWKICDAVTAEATYVFTGLTSGTNYYVSVKDDAGNVTTQSVYLPYYSTKDVELSITDVATPSYGTSNLTLPNVTYTSIQVTAPSGVTLTDAASVQAGYKTWGTTSANSKLSLVLGTASGNVKLTSGTKTVNLSNINSITLYNAAAYTVQEDREFTITMTTSKGDTAIINLTIPGITSKTLNMDVSLADGSISLQPGTSAESVSDDTSAIKNNNAYPISLTMSGVTAGAGSPTVVTSTPDKTQELKSAGVQVGIQTGSTKTYYTGSPISIGNLGYEATQQFNYLMKFSPLYTGDGGEKISYNVNFGVSVSAEDVS